MGDFSTHEATKAQLIAFSWVANCMRYRCQLAIISSSPLGRLGGAFNKTFFPNLFAFWKKINTFAILILKMCN